MSKAGRLAAKPTKAIKEIVADVQAIADQTQSYGYRFEDFDDGSRLEIRCAAKPRFEGQPPPASPEHIDALCASPNGLLRCWRVPGGAIGWLEADPRTVAFNEECAAGPVLREVQE